MKKILIASIVIAISGAAFAGQKCNVPKEQWIKEADFKLNLKKQGYMIKTVKITEGCYEIYGLDELGKRVEVLFDPGTGKLLESK